MSGLTRRALLACAFGIGFGLAQEDQSPVLRVTTRLVQLSVIVHDRSGRPVRDLTRDDFRIFDDGREKQVSLFSMGIADAGRLRAQPDSSPRSISNRRAGQQDSPVVATVILFDELNFSESVGGIAEWMGARKELMKFLATLEPGDPVALYVLTQRGVVVVHDFTDDVKSLARAAQRYLAAPVLPGRGAAPPGAPPAMEEWFRNTAAKARERERAEFSLPGLEAVAQAIAGIPGRKNLVWISQTFPSVIGLDPDSMAALASTGPAVAPMGMNPSPRQDYRENFHGRLKRVAQRLNDANLAVYPIDPRGLLVNGYRSGAPAQHWRTTSDDNGALWGTMDLFASETGGRAFYNANDVAGSIRRVMEDSQVTYLLGFYPGSEPDGRYHKLEVKVRRAGLTVRARRGYFANPSQVETSAERDDALLVAARSPLEASAIGVTLNVQSNPLGWWYQDVVVKVDPHDVRFTEENGRWRAAIDLAFIQQRRDGRILGGVKDAVQYALFFDTYEEALEQGLFFQRALYVRRDAARIRVIVRDAATSAAGSISVPVRQE